MTRDMTSPNAESSDQRRRDGVEKTHIVRAFWRVELEPILGRSIDGQRMVTGRAEGSVQIRIDSPDADSCRRDISFRAMAYGRELFILGIGKASQTKNDDGEETANDVDVSIASLPKNVMDFFMDLRKAIETQWANMQGSLAIRMVRGQGIVSARFRYRMSEAEHMQMNIIEAEEGDGDGQGKENCGSVRQLREVVE